ncbi:MAG: FadR family transcriptional regulator [Peptococcaceae bacterium]|nr:FadR family transcriptional regulator [Peptococcaceae bacterium]
MAVELKPIKTKKIYEEIVEQVKQLILDGHIKPGDKLPSERNLVDSFRVSRSSIREALSALEMMGLVEVRTGEGAYIRQVDPEKVAASFSLALTLEKGSILELLEVRRMIEIQAAGFAAERATAEELAQLEKNLYDMVERRSTWENADHNFHYNIARATHNNITIRLMDTIKDQMQCLIRDSYPKLFEYKYTPDLLFQEHYHIFTSLKEKNVDRAQETMLDHLKGVEEVILNHLNN